MNIVVLYGTLSKNPEERELPSGDRLVSYEVTVRPAEGRAESVPVVWSDGPASAVALPAGTEVMVVGRVRRRYFRSGGATQSRTEVVASTVLSKPTKRRVASLVDQVLEHVESLRPA